MRPEAVLVACTGRSSAACRAGHPASLRWHHYAGLTFGVVTFTWTFSGLWSMDPFPQLSTGGAMPAQRQAVAGAGASPGGEALDAGTVAAGVSAAAARLSPREMALVRVGGGRYWIASETPDRSVLIAAERPDRPAIERFPSAEIEELGRAAAPVPIADVTWLDGDDGYYRSRDAPRPLLVLRIRSGDRDGTWVYLDPRTGSIVQVLRRPDRVNRWLYHGLHSLDMAWLWHRRLLWDVTVIGLSLGGLALALSSATLGWRRVWKWWPRPPTARARSRSSSADRPRAHQP